MIGTNGEDAAALDEGGRIIDGEWGYACVENGLVFIPAVVATDGWPLRRVLAHLHAQTGLTRMVFSAVMNPGGLKVHLRNIVREWDEWVPEMEDHSHCIEIAYEVPQADDAVARTAGTSTD
jgi:hypothetical protein